MVDKINSASLTNQLLSEKHQSVTKTASNKVSTGTSRATVQSDQVNISYQSESVQTYNFNMSLEQTAGDGYDLLRGLVLDIFKEQGIEYTIDTGETEVDLSTITPEEAQELVADDGYFGVEKTAERIFNFAIGVAGGDTSRLDAIKEGVEQGFQEALDAFGGTLPDISYDTYDAVMSKLDEWAGVEPGRES